MSTYNLINSGLREITSLRSAGRHADNLIVFNKIARNLLKIIKMHALSHEPTLNVDETQLLSQTISIFQKVFSPHSSNHASIWNIKKHNQVLSENRAKSVMDWLVLNGIRSDRLTYKGYADIEPIKENTTEEGRAENRRTEFKIIGK